MSVPITNLTYGEFRALSHEAASVILYKALPEPPGEAPCKFCKALYVPRAGLWKCPACRKPARRVCWYCVEFFTPARRSDAQYCTHKRCKKSADEQEDRNELPIAFYVPERQAVLRKCSCGGTAHVRDGKRSVKCATCAKQIDAVGLAKWIREFTATSTSTYIATRLNAEGQPVVVDGDPSRLWTPGLVETVAAGTCQLVGGAR